MCKKAAINLVDSHWGGKPSQEMHTHIHMPDALTKSLPKPAFHKHREFLQGTAQSFSAFFASAHVSPVAAYVSRVTKRGGVVLSKASGRCIGG